MSRRELERKWERLGGGHVGAYGTSELAFCGGGERGFDVHELNEAGADWVGHFDVGGVGFGVVVRVR